MIAAIVLAALLQHFPQDPAPAEERKLVDRLNEIQRRLKDAPDDKELREQEATVRAVLRDLQAKQGADAFQRRFGGDRAAEERARLLNDMKRLDPKSPEHRRLVERLRALEPGFSQAYVDDMLHWARDFDPAAAARIEEALRQGRNDEAMGLALAFASRRAELEMLKTTDPEEFERRRKAGELEGEAVRLAEEARKAKGDERTAARDRLIEALGPVFEHREAARAREVQELERRINELKDTLKKRQENRKQIIDRRAQELLGDEYDW